MLLDWRQSSRQSTACACMLCLQEFQTVSALRDHLIAELNVPPELYGLLNLDLGIADGELPPLEVVRCPKCSKLCKGVRGFNQHFGKVHLRKKKHSVCKLCGNSFRHKYALRFHMKQVHSQAMRVSCSVCGSVLYNKYMLPKHMKKAHEGVSFQ